MHAFLFRLGGGAAEDEEVVPQRHLDLVLVPERLAAGLVPKSGKLIGVLQVDSISSFT